MQPHRSHIATDYLSMRDQYKPDLCLWTAAPFNKSYFFLSLLGREQALCEGGRGSNPEPQARGHQAGQDTLHKEPRVHRHLLQAAHILLRVQGIRLVSPTPALDDLDLRNQQSDTD